jgi:hypothetical protein
MIRSATSGDAVRLMDLWQTAGLRFHPGLAERELASVLAQDLALVDEEAGELTGTVFGTYDGTRGWVHRLATDVGLTALFSQTLAGAGISCNVIAGLAHDHLFVGWAEAARALALLRRL